MLFLGFIFATAITVALVVRLLYPPIWRDLLTLKIIGSFLFTFIPALKRREFVIDQFERHARRTPKKAMILFKDEEFTYGEVEAKACQVARVLMDNGVGHGDTVSLVMSNEPAYIWIYLGAQKLGARLALINHHLVSDGLAHSLQACSPKLIIVGDGLKDDYLPGKVFDLLPHLTTDAPIYSYNVPKEGVQFPCLSDAMEGRPADPVDPSKRSEIKLTDPSVFIYTSGTTGLPKPAIITHKKSMLCSMTYGPVGFSHKDVAYVPLPLYHASAMNLAVLNVINQGATLVLREKFSATHFWSDCVRYKATLVQYIGEMMRYLVNTPEVYYDTSGVIKCLTSRVIVLPSNGKECPEEKMHSLWGLAGNGLRRDVWVKMNARFNIPNIFEFYGSTEIPASLTNYFSEEGSVGRLSPLLSRLNGLVLVDVDNRTQKPFRDHNGRCRKTLPGGSGALIAKLSNKVTFDGYVGPASDTSSRILKDVFQEGDHYVTTNDVFNLDQDYNVFFKDRQENSIRWKGENVSSMEVSNVLINADFVQDANVYGVTVPGCEGKAGMAAISLKDGCDLDEDKVEELGRLSRDNLPGFARPRFLRFQRQMSLTSTFKQNKLDLAQEGFDIEKIEDPLYFLHRKDDTYHELDTDAFKKIVHGEQAL